MSATGFAAAASVWDAFRPAIVAALVAAALVLLARAGRLQHAGRAAPVMAMLLGWGVLGWRALPASLWAPRGWVDRLPGVALASLVLVLAEPFLPGRLARWAPWLLLAGIGWWLAAPLAARPEYWRVWLCVALFCWVTVRVVAGDDKRACAAALALWGVLLLLDSPVWAAAASVPAAATLAVLLLRPLLRGEEHGQAVAAACIAGAAATASLGGGFVLRGSVGALDAAALAPLAAAALQPVLHRRLGRAGSALGVPVAAGGAACVAWMLARALR